MPPDEFSRVKAEIFPYHELNEQLMLINGLNEEEKGILLKLIETFVSKKRFKDYLQKKIAAL